jgi:hypothetical protein
VTVAVALDWRRRATPHRRRQATTRRHMSDLSPLKIPEVGLPCEHRPQSDVVHLHTALYVVGGHERARDVLCACQITLGTITCRYR